MTLNRLVPLLGLLVVACGSGTGGPSLGGLFSSNGAPASQSDTPASQSDTPTGGGSPASAGAACVLACALAAKYPCLAEELPAQGCVEMCQAQLASEPEAALCAGPSIAWMTCADRAGLLACEDGDLKPTLEALAVCAKEFKAVPKECQSSSSTGSCEPGSCGGCESACDACMCNTNNDQQACASACGTSTGSCEPGSCGGCENACDACMCNTNNDTQVCASACGTSTGTCEPGSCTGCATNCDTCMCSTGNNSGACASLCADG